MSIGLIILAAGASTRLGRPKQLLEYRGKPLLQHTIDLAAELRFDSSVVVLGANAGEISEKIDMQTLDTVINEQWEEGMASSIRLGLSHLGKKESNLEHTLILLSDQPYLTIDVLNELLKVQTDSKSIVACGYNNQVGVPAVFSHHFFEDLMRLIGDKGARGIIAQNMDFVSTVPFVGGEIDVDTEEDYEGLSK